MNFGFADAFYFVARLNRRDQHHDRVLAGSRTFRAHRLTTDLVWMEVADALAKSACRPRIRDFILQRRPAAAGEIVPASRELLDRALDRDHQRRDKQCTLNGHLSLVVVPERGMADGLTEDHHFKQAGLVALLQ